jgi:hypothetical protein
MREASDSRDSADAWKQQKDKICCLTSSDAFEFTKLERRILKMMLIIAEEVGVSCRRNLQE